MSSKINIAFFGATGGCTISALSKTLEAGYKATALVRTPSKLTDMLLSRGIPQATLDLNLILHEGNAKDQAAVEKALKVNGRPVDLIVSGLGGVLKLNPFNPTLDDPTVCFDSMTTLLAALEKIALESKGNRDFKRPLLCVISTTGISTLVRDIPIAMMPLYHWLLRVPHADKSKMESLLVEDEAKGERSPVDGFVLVRPSLLVDGASVGTSKLRVGWERKTEYHSEIGYTITREDVGIWIFEDIVNSKEGRDKWKGKMVTLTA